MTAHFNMNICNHIWLNASAIITDLIQIYGENIVVSEWVSLNVQLLNIFKNEYKYSIWVYKYLAVE